jgi:hypothetical protein
VNEAKYKKRKKVEHEKEEDIKEKVTRHVRVWRKRIKGKWQNKMVVF